MEQPSIALVPLLLRCDTEQFSPIYIKHGAFLSGGDTPAAQHVICARRNDSQEEEFDPCRSRCAV